MEIAFIIGRILFGIFFVMMGIMHFTNRKGLIEYGKRKGAPLPELGVPVTGIMLLLGGFGVLLGTYVYIALGILIIFLLPITFMMHAFWKETDPQTKVVETTNFMKNVALIGALLMMFMLGEVWVYAII